MVCAGREEAPEDRWAGGPTEGDPEDTGGPSWLVARERFGGTNPGAAFFGWLVALGVSIILVGVVGAVATAVGASSGLTFSDAWSRADTYGVAALGTLLAILVIGYFAGGYVAGRMSRFDGGRQGSAVWMIGVLTTIVAGGVGAVAGREYDVLDRVDLPSLRWSAEDLTVAGLLAVLVALVLTAAAATLGGLAGRRYHDKVDRAVGILS